MTKETRKKVPISVRIGQIWQWAVGGFLLLIALLAAFTDDALASPGAPVEGYYASVAALALIGTLLLPPIFFRLPKVGRAGAYLGVLFAIGFWGTMLGQVNAAYEKTPEGAKIAAERRAEWEREREQDRQDAERAAEAEADQKRQAASAQRELQMAADMDEREEKLNDCISFWSGGIPDLIEEVKADLHNPDAFVHVETHFIPIPENNTTMVFRSENGFGAIRTGRVTATINPDNCTVISREGFGIN